MPILFSFLSNHRDFPSDSDSDDPDFEGGDSMDTEDSVTSEKVSCVANARLARDSFPFTEGSTRFDWRRPRDKSVCSADASQSLDILDD